MMMILRNGMNESILYNKYMALDSIASRDNTPYIFVVVTFAIIHISFTIHGNHYAEFLLCCSSDTSVWLRIVRWRKRKRERKKEKEYDCVRYNARSIETKYYKYAIQLNMFVGCHQLNMCISHCSMTDRPKFILRMPHYICSLDDFPFDQHPTIQATATKKEKIR